MALLCEISGLFIKKEPKNAQEKFSAANPRFIRMVMRVTEDRVKQTISPLGDGNPSINTAVWLYSHLVKQTISPLGDGNFGYLVLISAINSTS